MTEVLNQIRLDMTLVKSTMDKRRDAAECVRDGRVERLINCLSLRHGEREALLGFFRKEARRVQ